MISSAVVIPEQPPSVSHSLSSPTLKRRQSSLSPDKTKRPRLESQTSSDRYDDGYNKLSRPSLANSPSGQERSVSSSMRMDSIEEKKRGQRLFGALLGNLSNSSTKPAHRKRDEIERRQQERVRRENEERDEERRRKRAEIDKVRRMEQMTWNAEGSRIRLENTVAMARFLKTKTEPVLYYRPWELRLDEEERIQRQIKDAEELYRRDVGSSPGLSSLCQNQGIDRDSSQLPSAGSASESGSQNHTNIHKGAEQRPATSANTNGANGIEKIVMPFIDKDDQSAEDPRGDSRPRSSHHDQDDRGGEELVQGDEDDVIY